MKKIRGDRSSLGNQSKVFQSVNATPSLNVSNQTIATDFPDSSTCSSCAFRPGAEANAEHYNRLRSEICALSGVPFFCHHGSDAWKKIAIVVRGMLVAPGEQPVRLKICAGWKGRIQREAIAGTFRKNRLIRHGMGMAALQTLDEAVRTDDELAKPQIWEKLASLVRRLRQGVRHA